MLKNIIVISIRAIKIINIPEGIENILEIIKIMLDMIMLTHIIRTNTRENKVSHNKELKKLVVIDF